MRALCCPAESRGRSAPPMRHPRGAGSYLSHPWQVCWPDALLDPDLPTTRPINVSCIEEKVMAVIQTIATGTSSLRTTVTGSMVTGDWKVAASILGDAGCPQTMERVSAVLGTLQDVLDDLSIWINIEEPPSCYDDASSEYEEDPTETWVLRVELFVTGDRGDAVQAALRSKIARFLRIPQADVLIDVPVAGAARRLSDGGEMLVTILLPSEASAPLVMAKLLTVFGSAANASTFTTLTIEADPLVTPDTIRNPSSPPPPPLTPFGGGLATGDPPGAPSEPPSPPTSAFNDAPCFGRDSFATGVNGESIAMASLRSGDYVMDGPNSYTRVIANQASIPRVYLHLGRTGGGGASSSPSA